MQQTKQKIINTTIALFNKAGFANVSLPIIAKEMNISLGNLTYHFPKKAQLITSIFDVFVADLEVVTKSYRFTDLAEMAEQLQAFYDFQEKYLFFYLDLLELERAYPELKLRYQAHIKQQIAGIHQYFLYNESTGLMQSFEEEQIYEQFALQYWQTVVFWRMQVAVRGTTSTKEGLVQTALAILRPYLTAQGKNNLGENKEVVTKTR